MQTVRVSSTLHLQACCANHITPKSQQLLLTRSCCCGTHLVLSLTQQPTEFKQSEHTSCYSYSMHCRALLLPLVAQHWLLAAVACKQNACADGQQHQQRHHHQQLKAKVRLQRSKCSTGLMWLKTASVPLHSTSAVNSSTVGDTLTVGDTHAAQAPAAPPR